MALWPPTHGGHQAAPPREFLLTQCFGAACSCKICFPTTLCMQHPDCSFTVPKKAHFPYFFHLLRTPFVDSAVLSPPPLIHLKIPLLC